MEKPLKTILLIDDDVELLDITKRKLERSGFLVFCARNGVEAFTVVSDKPPDLIVLDAMMPEMDGFSFFKEIKRYQILCDIPIIILTGRASMKDSFLAVGANDFLAKPFNSQDLLDRINSVLYKEMTPQKGDLTKRVSSADASINVLLGANDPTVAEHVATILSQEGCPVAFAVTGRELLSRALSFSPQVIFLEVFLLDLPAHEIVKAMRSLSLLKETTILTYSYLANDEINNPLTTGKEAERVDFSRKCLENGADGDLGFLSDATVVDTLIDCLNQ